MRRADYSPAFRQLILPVTCTNPAVRRLAPLSLSPHPVRCLPCILCSVFCLLPTTPSLCPSISLCHSPHALILHSGFCILTSDFARPVLPLYPFVSLFFVTLPFPDLRVPSAFRPVFCILFSVYCPLPATLSLCLFISPSSLLRLRFAQANGLSDTETDTEADGERHRLGNSEPDTEAKSLGASRADILADPRAVIPAESQALSEAVTQRFSEAVRLGDSQQQGPAGGGLGSAPPSEFAPNGTPATMR